MPRALLYAQLETLMAPDAILASNTSNLDIFPLVPPGLQQRTIIAHWYTPPYLCDLVDLCPGPRTDPAAIATVRDMVRAMGKVPVVFKQMVQGYVANRLQAAMGLEVQRMLDEGLVSAKDIDELGDPRHRTSDADPRRDGEGRLHRAASDAAGYGQS